MKNRLYAFAALPLAAMPMHCDPNPPVHQQATIRNVVMNASAACAVFNASLMNNHQRPYPEETWTFYVDGIETRSVSLPGGGAETVRINVPNDSGDHFVEVRWAGPTSLYRVWTDCGP